MQITAEDLHEAADICASFGGDETRIAEYGATAEAIADFVLGSDWREVDLSGPYMNLDPMALGIGVAVGVVAARRAAAARPATSATIHSTDSRR